MKIAVLLLLLATTVAHAQNSGRSGDTPAAIAAASVKKRIVVPMSVYEAFEKNKRRIELHSVIHEDPAQDGPAPAGCRRECDTFEICSPSNRCHSKRLCWLVCDD